MLSMSDASNMMLFTFSAEYRSAGVIYGMFSALPSISSNQSDHYSRLLYLV